MSFVVQDARSRNTKLLIELEDLNKEGLTPLDHLKVAVLK